MNRHVIALCVDDSDKIVADDDRPQPATRFSTDIGELMDQNYIKALGIKDEPLRDIASDQLNLAEHAEILTSFIRQCDTPMTIGIQGDWGSGKTSMINIIKHKLDADAEHKYVTAVFNTWLYSQFNLGDQLSLSLIADLIETVAEHTSDSSKPKKQSLDTALRTLGRFAVSTANIAGTLYSGSEFNLMDHLQPSQTQQEQDQLRPVQMLSRLKSDVQTLINDARITRGIERFVIFVDDLDRLVPSRAVELLEALKIFLDVEGCVFVLACDYQVVSRGIREKFGHQEQDLDGRSFFDKIIQVPYNMPTHQYDSRRFLRHLLDRISESTAIDDECVSAYRELVMYSVGLNPRSCKRLFNSFLLLRLVSKRERLFERLAEEGVIVNDLQQGKVLFAVICLQMAYERAFKEMCKRAIDIRWFDNVDRDEYWTDENKARKLTRTEQESNRFRAFLRAFRQAVRMDSESNADTCSTQDQARVLQKVLNSSTVTVVSENPMDATEPSALPAYISAFFSTLTGKELASFPTYGPEETREAKTAYYETTIYIDDDEAHYLYVCLEVKTKYCDVTLVGGGQSKDFLRIRDYLVGTHPDRWAVRLGDGGRKMQKEVDYLPEATPQCLKADLVSNPTTVAQRLRQDVLSAFESLREASEAMR